VLISMSATFVWAVSGARIHVRGRVVGVAVRHGDPALHPRIHTPAFVFGEPTGSGEDEELKTAIMVFPSIRHILGIHK